MRSFGFSPRLKTAEGLLADQHRNEQEAGDESQCEQLEVFADRTPGRFRDGVAQAPLAKVAWVGRKGWTSEPHGKSLTWILPCSNSAFMRSAPPVPRRDGRRIQA